MSRYYSLELTPSGATTPIRTWTSHPNGVYDPAALQIEYDALVGPYGTPSGGSTITLHGIPLQDLTQAQQFAGMTLELKAGMKAGLPLVNPAQAGTILKGQVFQSFGNWQGIEQTLDFVVIPSAYTTDNPGNFVLTWRAGMSLSDALLQTLDVAYPDTPISINIGSDLVQSYDEIHVCGTLDELSQLVGDITEGVFDDRVQIGIQGGQIVVWDSTYSPGPIQINFTDLIGQPTWIGINTMQIKTVARADLQMGGIIRMPKGLQNAPGFVTTTQAATLPAGVKYKTTFQDNFSVLELRQIGNFRAPDAAQWATIINCVVQANG